MKKITKTSFLMLFFSVLISSLVSCSKKDTTPTTVKDIDGNTYNIIQIGDQFWMKENLKVSKFKNGDNITEVTDNVQWSGLSTPALCFYDNDEANEDPYGLMYNWYVVKDSRGLCPTGWHVPTVDDWTELTDFLGGELVAGGKLKESGTSHWQSPNEGATNSSGFTAVPGGRRNTDGSFIQLGTKALFWTSTEFNSESAMRNGIENSGTEIESENGNKKYGFSVRCIKD
jgi:uncharacterized protein (TIGR02145 family)